MNFWWFNCKRQLFCKPYYLLPTISGLSQINVKITNDYIEGYFPKVTNDLLISPVASGCVRSLMLSMMIYVKH